MILPLTRLYELYLLALDRTGFAVTVSGLQVPIAPERRAAWLVVGLAVVVLALYGALASGPDHGVEAFRAFAFVGAVTLPIAGLRLVPTAWRAPFGGAVLVTLFAFGLVHRLLARRRRDGTASRAVERVRWLFEMAGLALFAAGVWQVMRGREVPLSLAFWALFLLRLSISDLIDPSTLAEETGLRKSAVKDLKAAAKGKRNRPSRLGKGLVKGLLLVVWLVLPVAAALARGEVERGEWPREALFLTHYPAAALGLTALVLLVRAVKGVRTEPVDSLREAVAGAATGLYLFFAYRDPAFASYRDALPGLYLVETAFGFLLGASRAYSRR